MHTQINDNIDNLVFFLKSTFERAQEWVSELQRQANPKLLIILVGNKTDVEERSVDYQEAKSYAADTSLLYVETSARLGTNISQVFTEIGKLTIYIYSINSPYLTLPSFFF